MSRLLIDVDNRTLVSGALLYRQRSRQVFLSPNDWTFFLANPRVRRYIIKPRCVTHSGRDAVRNSDYARVADNCNALDVQVDEAVHGADRRFDSTRFVRLCACVCYPDALGRRHAAKLRYNEKCVNANALWERLSYGRGIFMPSGWYFSQSSVSVVRASACALHCSVNRECARRESRTVSLSRSRDARLVNDRNPIGCTIPLFSRSRACSRCKPRGERPLAATAAR